MATSKEDLIADLAAVVADLGRVPTRYEFKTKSKYRAAYERTYGTWGNFLTAAGYVAGLRKLDNSVFEKKIDAHLESHVPPEEKPVPVYPTIATISDIHWPFSCDRIVDKFQAYVGRHKPEYVFLNGDAWDMYSYTNKFPKSHNIFTPREEQRAARMQNEEFWKTIQKASPKSKCVQTMGNHDMRPLRSVLEAFPAAEDWIEKALAEMFTFPNVETIFDPRQEYKIGNILIFHGYKTQLGSHRDYTLFNCINGHSHVGGVVYRRLHGQTLWELNSGYAGDPTAKGLSWTPQKITNWTPGFGYVDEYGPRFIPA